MNNDLTLGFVWGFIISFVGAAFWMTEPDSDPLAALAGWLPPATLVGGLILLAHRDHRRLGGGVVLGSLTVAILYVAFIIWLVAQVGS